MVLRMQRVVGRFGDTGLGEIIFHERIVAVARFALNASLYTSAMQNISVQPGIYRHYKGNLYRVLGIAKQSETLEDMVMYEALYPNTTSRFWVRPLAMFQETIEVDGKTVSRFQRMVE